MKINQKLTLGFLSIALLVGVVGYLAVNASQKTLQESIGEDSVTLAVETMNKIDRDIYARIEGVQVYAEAMLILFEDQARWRIKNKLTDATEVPNYLNYIYIDALHEVKPEACTIIH